MRKFKTVALLVVIASITGCSSYKSSWSCKNPEGIGCSSVFYADEMARKHIILNEEKKLKSQKKKVLIRDHHSDFEKYKTKVIEID